MTRKYSNFLQSLERRYSLSKCIYGQVESSASETHTHAARLNAFESFSDMLNQCSFNGEQSTNYRLV